MNDVLAHLLKNTDFNPNEALFSYPKSPSDIFAFDLMDMFVDKDLSLEQIKLFYQGIYIYYYQQIKKMIRPGNSDSLKPLIDEINSFNYLLKTKKYNVDKKIINKWDELHQAVLSANLAYFNN